MYYIIFYDSNGFSEIYSGGTYIFQGSKYACFDSNNPKLYKSMKVAENVAKNLSLSCENTSLNFEIREKDRKEENNA